MSQWTSERAILRDLSRAQGGGAVLRRSRSPHASCSPRPRLRPLRAAERPPRAATHEETEEEYFERCVGDGALHRPDLGLIQHMLNMVREQNVTEDDPNITDVAVISKLNPTSPEFIPTTKPLAEGSVPVNNGKTKKNRQRNIALESILQALECQEQTKDTNVIDAPLNLLKPEDLIPNSPEGMVPSPTHMLEHGDVKTIKCSDEDTNVEKVKTWLTKIKSPIKIKPVTVILESTNMFKKKSKPIAATPGTGLNKDIRDKEPTKIQYDRTYKPSTTADDYYKKYLDKSQLMDSLNDDIWTKAEKKMKQIDEKRRLAATVTEKLAAEAATEQKAAGAPEPDCLPVSAQPHLHTAEPGTGASSGAHEDFHNEIKRVPAPAARALSGWAAVRLPRARHALSAAGAAGGVAGGARGLACVVCAALGRWRHAPPAGPARSTLACSEPEERAGGAPAPTDASPDDVTGAGGTPLSTPEWIRRDAAGLFD